MTFVDHENELGIKACLHFKQIKIIGENGAKIERRRSGERDLFEPV
jgi:hypothetical protein